MSLCFRGFSFPAVQRTGYEAFSGLLDAVAGRMVVYGRREGDSIDKINYSGDNGASWGEISRDGNWYPNVTGVASDPWRPGWIWISTGGRSAAIFLPDNPRSQYERLPTLPLRQR